MSQLVAYYDEKPVELRGHVEVEQAPIAVAAGARSVDGAIRTALVYVRVPSEAGPFLVPFGEYDDWSLRDRYNEAIRIMNTLGASEITCETFGERTGRRGIRARIQGRGPEIAQQRVENSGFDFRHTGAGSARAIPGRCGGPTNRVSRPPSAACWRTGRPRSSSTSAAIAPTPSTARSGSS